MEKKANPKAELDQRRAEMYPERQMSMSKIISALPTKPVRIFILLPLPFSFLTPHRSQPILPLPPPSPIPPTLVGSVLVTHALNSSSPSSRKAMVCLSFSTASILPLPLGLLLHLSIASVLSAPSHTCKLGRSKCRRF